MGIWLFDDFCVAFLFHDFGAWSFDSMKQLVMGDGGFVYIKDKDLMQQFIYETYLGLKSSSGFSNSIDTKWWEFDVDCSGRRSIINDIQGAMGVEQIKKIDGFIDRRKEIHNTYNIYYTREQQQHYTKNLKNIKKKKGRRTDRGSFDNTPPRRLRRTFLYIRRRFRTPSRFDTIRCGL